MRQVTRLARVGVLSATQRMWLLVVGAVVATLWPAAAAQASFILPSFAESSQYLLIARMQINGNQDISTNNFELGGNNAPVPATGNFLDGGSSGGPTLQGAVPALPSNAAPVLQGRTFDGNIAVTDPRGEFHLQDVGVYADRNIGIRVAGPAANSATLNQSSNAFFNDPNQFPNTFDTNTQTGLSVNPGAAVQSTRIDNAGVPGNAGVTYSVDHSGLITELAAARTAINRLIATDVLLTGGTGVISSDTKISLSSGLNVIDINTGGNDLLLNNVNFVIDGSADAFAIFRLPDNDNMLIANSNILIGNGGIGLNNVMFYTDQPEGDTHFAFDNTIINGIAFWSLGPNGGNITINNAQGCTQLVADLINLNDVRFIRSSFIPAPSSGLVILAGASLLSRRRRRRSGGKSG